MSDARHRTVLIASYDETFAERATNALYPHYQVIRSEPEFETLARSVETVAPDICLIDIDEANWDGSPQFDVVEGVHRLADGMSIVVATYDISIATVVPAMRAGANDVTDKDFAPDALLAQIDWLVQSRPVARGSETGRLLTVLGMRGGTGATSVAVALALELAHRQSASESTLLVDLSYPPPEVPATLGLTANYSVKDAINDVSRLDATMIDNAFARIATHKLFVLPLALTYEDADSVGSGEALNLMTVLRTYFRTVIVDANPTWRPAFAERIFLDAQTALLCCGQSIPALNAASVFLDGLRERHGVEPEFRLVVPRHDSGLLPSADELNTALGAKGAPFLIPEDRRRIDTLRNSAQPLIEPRSRTPLAKAIRAIADQVIETDGDAEAASAARSFWSRFGRRRTTPIAEAAE